MLKSWRPRWVKHSPVGWLFGWTYYPVGEAYEYDWLPPADGWFCLHVGPGFLEWGIV